MYHPDVTPGAGEEMYKATNGCLYHYGSSHGAGDCRDCVRWLGAHLLGLPAHKAPSQERARARPIVHPHPYAQVGTVELDIIRSIGYIAQGHRRPIKAEADQAAVKICEKPCKALSGSENKHSSPQSEGSTVVFIRHLRQAESHGFAVMD